MRVKRLGVLDRLISRQIHEEVQRGHCEDLVITLEGSFCRRASIFSRKSKAAVIPLQS